MQCSAAIALLACTVCAQASYLTYIGDANQYQVSAIATDAAGNTYITGSRAVVPGAPYLLSDPAVTDVFVSKLDPSGNLALLATFSGKGEDQANGIAVDPSGNIYIAGVTTSTDFPLHGPLQSVPYGGSCFPPGTGFLMKLSPDGTPVYSTYLGGMEGDSALYGVAADSNGNAYVTGTTTAQDYPHTAGMPAGGVGCYNIQTVAGAFFAKIDPAGDHILYAGVLEGPDHGCVGVSSIYSTGSAIAVDPAGNAYVAGNTAVGLATTPGALQANGIGAFVAKVNAAGTGLVYATYLGAGDFEPTVGTVATDSIYAIAADAAGNAYISGSTSDPSFPATTGAFQPALANAANPPFVGPSDAFVAKLNPSGTAMVWATFLGGTAADSASTVAADSAGNVWVSGTTNSTNFPTTAPVSPMSPNGSDFLAELNSTGSKLSYSALFPAGTVRALAVDSSGTVHAGGVTGLISAFPAGSAPGQTAVPWMFGIGNAAGGTLAGRLAPGELISLYGLHIGPTAPVSGTFGPTGFLPTQLGGVQIAINSVAAPLLYVSDGQINAIAPIELTAGSSVELQVTQNGTALPGFRTVVDIAAPGVFLIAPGRAAAVNQDGTVNSASNPAKVGSYVSIWTTGTGYFPGSDGQIATGANEFCGKVLSCSIFEYYSGTQANISYTGAAPDIVNGVIQINFQVGGSGTYFFSADGISSAISFGVATTP